MVFIGNPDQEAKRKKFIIEFSNKKKAIVIATNIKQAIDIEKDLNPKRNIVSIKEDLPPKRISRRDHIKRHKELHHKLDELVADFLDHNNGVGTLSKLPSNTKISELIEWSYKQTTDPSEKQNGKNK